MSCARVFTSLGCSLRSSRSEAAAVAASPLRRWKSAAWRHSSPRCAAEVYHHKSNQYNILIFSGILLFHIMSVHVLYSTSSFLAPIPKAITSMRVYLVPSRFYPPTHPPLPPPSQLNSSTMTLSPTLIISLSPQYFHLNLCFVGYSVCTQIFFSIPYNLHNLWGTFVKKESKEINV